MPSSCSLVFASRRSRPAGRPRDLLHQPIGRRRKLDDKLRSWSPEVKVAVPQPVISNVPQAATATGLRAAKAPDSSALPEWVRGLGHGAQDLQADLIMLHQVCPSHSQSNSAYRPPPSAIKMSSAIWGRSATIDCHNLLGSDQVVCTICAFAPMISRVVPAEAEIRSSLAAVWTAS